MSNEEQMSIKYDINYLAKIPYDVFSLIVLQDDDLRGKNLISLCLASSEINAKCNNKNQELFKRLLENDYNITESINPREEYIEWSQMKVWTFGNGLYGRLGHGNKDNQLVPQKIEGFKNIKNVACGFNHTAFLQ